MRTLEFDLYAKCSLVYRTKTSTKCRNVILLSSDFSECRLPGWDGVSKQKIDVLGLK